MQFIPHSFSFKCNNLNFVDGQLIKNSFFLVLHTTFQKYYRNSLTVNCNDKLFSYVNDLNSTDTCLVLKQAPKKLTSLCNQLNSFFLILSKTQIILETVSIKILMKFKLWIN